MRILLISWEYPPVIEGGLGRHVFQLSRSLAQDGHEVHVLTRGPDGGDEPVPAPVSAGTQEIQVHRVEIPAFTRELDAFMVWVESLNAQLAARGAELIDDLAFDLIHSHDWLVAGAAEQLSVAGALPWLVTVHATEFGRHGGWVHTHPQYEIHMTERHMVRHADAIICCSRYMAGHVERVFGLERGSVDAIPNGIDPGELRPPAQIDLAALRRRHAAAEESLVLLVGRLVHEKGFHLALEALAELPDVRFLCAGTGTAEAELHRQATTLGLHRRGRFLGRVDDDVLHALYGIADVTVVPSLYEPFGIVPLEAMAAGCPVLVADTGGLREVVEGSQAAELFTPGDAAELASTLAALLADPARLAEMSASGRTHSAHFDWTDVSTRTEALYAEALSRAGALRG